MSSATQFSTAAIPDDRVRLKVFLGYTDDPHKRLGKIYCNRLARDLCPVVKTVITEWQLGALSNATINVIAAAEARNACLSVIAMSHGERLPSGVRMWFERWCATKSSPAAILAVVLTDVREGSSRQWVDYAYLEAQSRAYGVHLLICSGDVSAEALLPARLATARRTAMDTLFEEKKSPSRISVLSALPALRR